MDALDRAIEGFYRSFADVAKPQHIDGCPCCIETSTLQKLQSIRLRELSAEDLASFASSALLTVGGPSDYLYFLPRILEISIRDESWWPDIEVTARAIRSTDFQSWPPLRRQALLSLFEATIDAILDSKSYRRIDGWLCAIARIGIDVHPYLQKVEKDRAAVLEYFEDNAASLGENRLCNSFWELPNQGHDAIVKWFKSAAIRAIPFEAYGHEM